MNMTEKTNNALRNQERIEHDSDKDKPRVILDYLKNLTSEDFSKWWSKSCDFKYDVRLTCQPGFTTEGPGYRYFTPKGKRYALLCHYWVFENYLLVWSQRSASEFSEYNELVSKEIINLKDLDLMTHPIVKKERKGLIFTSECAVYAAEQFYFKPKTNDTFPCLKAFTLRFPEDANVDETKNAAYFSGLLKKEIHNAYQQSNENEE